MLDSLGQVLPHAARRFGDKTALVIEGRSFSFRELDESVERAGREPGQARRQARRSGDALRAEFLGMDRQLLRRAEDRRRDQSGQRHAHAGRGRLRHQGLRRESADRQPGKDRAALWRPA